MKNLKDNLYYWRKHWFATILVNLLFVLPTVIFIIPIGHIGEFDYFKWIIFGYVVFFMYIVHQNLIRIEAHESTIEELNKEIEELKKKIEDGILS